MVKHPGWAGLAAALVLLYAAFLIFGELSKTTPISKSFFVILLGLMVIAIILETIRLFRRLF